METMRPALKKATRTISGVTPVAVMTRPGPCPGHCVYCPTFAATPQSYTPESPAVLRARECGYDAARQVRVRLDGLADMGHPVDKVELIIMGGTFLATPLEYQYAFVKACYDALNGTESPSLEEAKRLNETAASRCVGLCIETRPDYCARPEIERMLEFGATRVEIGVQTLDDGIFRLVNRGHGVREVIDATRLLKQHGLKVHYHWMPGLPGSNPDRDLEMSRRLFDDHDFRPDGLKIYPTMVVSGTELENWYRDGRYQPYDDSTMLDLVADIKAVVPPYVRISRVLRDIPAKFIVGGLKVSLRGPVKARMQERGLSCRCIRCREYGHRRRAGLMGGAPSLHRLDYDASGGREVFLSFDDESGTMFGLLRLRVQSESILAIRASRDDQPGAIPSPLERKGEDESEARQDRHREMTSWQPAAVVRELHVYGSEVPLRQQDDSSAQHRGLGRALLREAERIARHEFGVRQLVVLSGVGAREYYRESGYTVAGHYMLKPLA
jgi:elongator complex protein 3